MDPLAQFAPISLEELTVRAELLRRFDTKYIVPLQRIEDVYDAFSDSTLILENDGRRVTSYVTAYFDSEDLHTYFDHLKKRRKRFKIRTRYYAESTNGFLEIKIKMPRGQTQKVRWPLDVSQAGSQLTDEHRESLNEALQSSLYQPLSHQYRQTLTTTFSRTTLFDPATLERITIDFDLLASSDGASVELGHRHAIIEIKSPTQVGHAHRIFTQLGIRPVSVSKYCIAMTALHPEHRGTPWRKALRVLRVPE
jgi:hypothetical protein